MQKLITFLIFVLIAALVALVTIPQWGVKKPDKLVIGHFPDVPNGWLYFGLDQGLFEKYKLDPQLVEFFSYDEALDSLLNGKIDCFFSFPWSFLLKEISDTLTEMSDTANQLKVIASFCSTPDSAYGALIVPQNSRIKTMKKLRREKVGVSTYPHNELEILLRRSLEKEIPEQHVRVEHVDKGEISSLLENQKIAAALLYEPDLTRILERGETKVLTEDPISTYLINPYPLYAACIATSFLAEKGEAALNFRSVLEEFFKFGVLNETDMRNSLTNYMRITVSQSLKVRLPSFQIYETVNSEAIQNFSNLLAGEDILPETTGVEGILFEMFE